MTSAVIEISDSQIKAFQACPRKWVYNKVLKLDAQENEDNRVLGDAVHSGLEEFIKSRSMDKALKAALDAIKEGKPTNPEHQVILAPAMVQGWVIHFLPGFERDYEYINVEEWFSTAPHPQVHLRGFIDAVTRNRRTGGIHLGDYKTSSQSGGGDLGRTTDFNQQLARYALAWKRLKGVWPEEVSLIFLQKPKQPEHARTNPDLYYRKSKQVTPAFAAFALDVERSDVLLAQQMSAYRDLIKAQGPQAAEFVPANFDKCFSYGTLCGFAPGCHSGCPAHRSMRG